MFHVLMPKSSWRVVCVVVAAIGVRVGLAATAPARVTAFTGRLTSEAPPPFEPLSLWYRQPTTAWASALPVGNGRQGTMVFGGIDAEILCLNEDTLWAGGPYTLDNPESLAALLEVRQLIWDGKYAEAQRLISQKMMAKPLGQLPYQPVGDLLLAFPPVAHAETYRRELNLHTATASAQFTSEGTTFTRELFVSVIIDKAAARGYDALRKDQLADHRTPFDRVSLDMGATDNSKLPIDLPPPRRSQCRWPDDGHADSPRPLRPLHRSQPNAGR